jgi:hypothetical protein
MTSKDDPKNQLRSTMELAEEAERFLQSLDAEPDPDMPPQQPPPLAPRVGGDAIGSNAAHPALLVLIIVILLSPLALFVLWQNIGQSPSNSLPALSYFSSCGSAPGVGKWWWPVLGPADRSLLRTIRNQYCGDAYITPEGSLQIASFDSWQGANRFRQQLQKATKASFRVGTSIYR